MTKEEMEKWFNNCKEFEKANNMGSYTEEMYQAFKTRLKAECNLNIWPEE